MKRTVILTAALLCAMGAAPQNPLTTVRPDTTRTRELDEVTVTAARDLTRFDADGMITNIEGSVLSKLGTAKDVLGYLPGLINNGGSIEVLGKGTPVFYIIAVR